MTLQLNDRVLIQEESVDAEQEPDGSWVGGIAYFTYTGTVTEVIEADHVLVKVREEDEEYILNFKYNEDEGVWWANTGDGAHIVKVIND